MNVVSRLIQYIIAAMLLFMALLMFTEVLRRYFFSHQFVWSEELIRYLAVWVAFLGGAAAFKEKSLVCFDLVSGRFKGVVKLVIELLSNTVVVVFMCFIFYLGMKTVTSPSTYRQISVGMKVSMAFPYAAIPAGSILMVLFGVNNYFNIIEEYLQKSYEDKEVTA
ncbi:MAG: TRAP transporter small permease [Clostridiales bacterium]|nr:TRAP transporter small permease [Clostridiales bacterium]